MPTEILQFISQYKELITNGLDLLSFALITPQLSRVARPIVGVGTLSFLALILFGLMLYSDAYLALTFGFSINLALGSSIILSGLIWLLASDVLERFGKRVAHYSFAFGIFFFFLSRLIAFVIAVHEVRPPAR